MDKLTKWKEEYQQAAPPSELLDKLNKTMEQAAWEKKKQRVLRRKWMSWAAVLVILISIPNVNADAARIMGNIPIIGGLFRLITVREYQYDDGHSEAKASVPMMVAQEEDMTGGGFAITEENAVAEEAAADTAGMAKTRNITESTIELNSQVEGYIDGLITEFEENMEEIGEGYQGLDISYEVVTDTDTWFTLRIDAVQTMASGAQHVRYYHIDKDTGNIAELKDLFREDADYVTVLSDEIKKQMVQQMEADEDISYFYNSKEGEEDEFQSISETQNFYFTEENELVIVFEEYEIAPGFMGCPEFVIPDDVYKEIKK